MVVGDFNSHSQSWGYIEAERRGQEVEDLQINSKLQLLNKADDPGPTSLTAGGQHQHQICVL